MPYVIAQVALAGANGAFAEIVELDRVKSYIERALIVFQSAEGRSSDLASQDWENYFFIVQAAGNRFLGLYALRKNHAFELAIQYFSRAIAIKSLKTTQGWKDPENYLLRAESWEYGISITKVKYEALPMEQKNGEPGKALLDRIKNYTQQAVEDYARMLALVQGRHTTTSSIYNDYIKGKLQMLLPNEPNRDVIIQNLIKRFLTEFAA